MRVRLNHEGRLSTVAKDPAPAILRTPGDYRVFAGPGHSHLWVRDGEARGRTRVLMMGEIIHRMSVVEVINVITSTNWTGELHVRGDAGSRVLDIAQGLLMSARTEIKSERIGELLVRSGLLQSLALPALLAEQRHDEHFGQLLLRNGLLQEEQLFKQLQLQTETIFYGALLVESGTYWFVTPPESAVPAHVTVRLSIQGLLMEGVQRIDEMALYREKIPHNRFFPAAISDAKVDKLDAVSRGLLALCNGSRSIDELIPAGGLGEYVTVKTLHQLQRSGLLTLRVGPQLNRAAAQHSIRYFNEIMRDIFIAVATYTTLERIRGSVAAWLGTGAPRALLGDEVDLDGSVDISRVLAQLEQRGSDDPMEELLAALHELCAYTLLAAASDLPRERERALARDVNGRLRRLKL